MGDTCNFRLLFLDILNYCNGKCSLRTFLREMNVPSSQSKLYFWYEKWAPKNTQKLLMRSKPPVYEDFYSNLKGWACLS